MRKTLALIALTVIALPLLTFAAPSKPPTIYELNGNALPGGPTSILTIIEAIGDWIFTILLVLAVIFLLLAAYNYMGGSEEGVAKAHRMVMYTAIAVAVALLSIGIVTAIRTFITNPTA